MSIKNPRHIYVYKDNQEDPEMERMNIKSAKEEYDFFYKECKIVCPKIAEALSRENRSIHNSCKAPSSYGLENSEQIIPKYYFSGKDLQGKILECDFFFSIIDSIRNLRLLNRYQQQYIERLEKDDCYQLLLEYNKAMESVISCIMLDDIST